MERRSKAQIMVHELILHLKSRPPLFLAPSDEMKDSLGLGNSLKKLVKHADFVRFLRLEVVPYRTVFPHAAVEEWRAIRQPQMARREEEERGPDGLKEKMVRVIRLMDPETDPETVWSDPRDEEEEEEEEEEDDDGEGAKRSSSSSSTPGVCDQSGWRLDRTVMRQVYDLLVARGARGITQQQLGAALGVTKLESRTLCRNLSRRGLTSTVMREQGRQRTSAYVASQFAHLSRDSEEAKVERRKLKEQLLRGAAARAGESPAKSPKKRSKEEEKEKEEGFRLSPSKSPRKDPDGGAAAVEDPEVSVSVSEQVMRNALRAAGAGKMAEPGQVRRRGRSLMVVMQWFPTHFMYTHTHPYTPRASRDPLCVRPPPSIT